jgi:hypothetical protein
VLFEHSVPALFQLRFISFSDEFIAKHDHTIRCDYCAAFWFPTVFNASVEIANSMLTTGQSWAVEQ